MLGRMATAVADDDGVAAECRPHLRRARARVPPAASPARVLLEPVVTEAWMMVGMCVVQVRRGAACRRRRARGTRASRSRGIAGIADGFRERSQASAGQGLHGATAETVHRPHDQLQAREAPRLLRQPQVRQQPLPLPGPLRDYPSMARCPARCACGWAYPQSP
ncbi:hypothetical protein CHLRE_09g395176v5 [Chlamydomonas reinhardtii]|uniref:Uncharacterized protein n=1 Tax=Chlamydomonas reinhardtii TaxID=3055 RepID=A0A2K3DEI1_CHLRE|nr:uncharacterized protein CHLRE_09g395176v5 [Chlamydomonas reinhardtii]PNW78939.1 hypothetical protein CHLRE_09g395176v5 [Chlamydomonas reinhardtii]